MIFLTVLIVSSFAVRRSRDLGRRVEARATRLPCLRVSVLSRIFRAASVATKGRTHTPSWCRGSPAACGDNLPSGMA